MMILPHPTDPPVIELAAFARILRHCPDVPEADRLAAVERRAREIGFDPDGAAGELLGFAVLMATPLLPDDCDSLIKLARVKARRVNVH